MLTSEFSAVDGPLAWSDDPEERLRQIAELDAAAAEHVHRGKPANTRRAYADDYRVWVLFTKTLGLPAQTCTAGLLVMFTLWLDRGHQALDEAGRLDRARSVTASAPSTIRRRLYGAVAELRYRGVDVPAHATALAFENIKAIERRLAEDGEQRGRGKAEALTITAIRAICAGFPDTLTGLRDRALLLIGFGIAGRRAELAALTVTDIDDDPHGLVVTVRVSKTKTRTVPIPYGAHRETCPVRAWQAWKAAAGLVDGHAFRSIDRWGNLGAGMSGKYVGEAVTAAGRRAGITIHYTGHSVRAGFATEARRASHDVAAIAAQGGWEPTSRVLFGYIRIVDQWTDNALIGIGL